MNAKQHELLKESFKNGFFHVFDNNDDANKVHQILNEKGVKHEFGDYLHTVDGKRRYNLGIRVLDKRMMQDLINEKPDATAPENPKPEKQPEQNAGQVTTEPVTLPVIQNVGDNEEEAEAAQEEETRQDDPKPANKKNRRKKVNL